DITAKIPGCGANLCSGCLAYSRKLRTAVSNGTCCKSISHSSTISLAPSTSAGMANDGSLILIFLNNCVISVLFTDSLLCNLIEYVKCLLLSAFLVTCLKGDWHVRHRTSYGLVHFAAFPFRIASRDAIIKAPYLIVVKLRLIFSKG